MERTALVSGFDVLEEDGVDECGSAVSLTEPSIVGVEESGVEESCAATNWAETCRA